MEPARLRAGWLVAGIAAVLVVTVLSVSIGPIRINPWGVVRQLIDEIPGVHIATGLSPRDAAVVTQLRLPRVCLGLLVGAMLSLAGGCYQGVFRNPLADPYLLGVAAGAGLGATAAIAAAHAFAALAGRGRLRYAGRDSTGRVRGRAGRGGR